MINRNYVCLFFTGLLLIVCMSCSNRITKHQASEELVIFPAPPDTARIQFLTSISDSKDVVEKQSAFSKFVLGENESKPINKPYGIHIDKSKIYICDISIKGLEIIDLEKNTFDYFIPKGRGALLLPANCYVDNDGFLYIADVQRRQVVIFDSKRNYVASIGEKENFKPTDVFVDNEKIWISNNANNRICVYNKANLEFIDYFPKSESGDSSFLYSPTNLFVSENTVYVSDFGDFKIKKYDHEGKYLNSVGSYGKNLGQFVRPKGIAVDRNSNLYVVDAGFENTQIFDKNGKLLMFFGGSYNGAGYMWLPAKVIIDYDNLKYFEKYVDDAYSLKYLILVTNQYGPDKVNVYGSIELKKKE